MTGTEVFDWRGAEHWSSRLYRCRLCSELTQLRDDQGQPCHKRCAEQEATREEETTEWNDERWSA